MTKNNIKSKAYENRHGVRELVEKATNLGFGVYRLVDVAGRVFQIDTVNGLCESITYRELSNGMVEKTSKCYIDGTKSKKENGYLYTTLKILDLNGKEKTVTYGNHNIVAMLAHKQDFDAIVKTGLVPICNHKNNRKWDNRASNLEWTTFSGNAEHGKIVYSLYSHFGFDYLHKENNQSDKDFHVLDNTLSVRDIDRYIKETGNKIVFNLTKKNKNIKKKELLTFVEWLIDNGLWGIPVTCDNITDIALGNYKGLFGRYKCLGISVNGDIILSDNTDVIIAKADKEVVHHVKRMVEKNKCRLLLELNKDGFGMIYCTYGGN